MDDDIAKPGEVAAMAGHLSNMMTEELALMIQGLGKTLSDVQTNNCKCDVCDTIRTTVPRIFRLL